MGSGIYNTEAHECSEDGGRGGQVIHSIGISEQQLDYSSSLKVLVTAHSAFPVEYAYGLLVPHNIKLSGNSAEKIHEPLYQDRIKSHVFYKYRILDH